MEMLTGKILLTVCSCRQVNFKPKLLSREGNYRILGWYNDQNHTEWLDSTKDKESSYGFGLSFDQELTDTVVLFDRYVCHKPKVN